MNGFYFKLEKILDRIYRIDWIFFVQGYFPDEINPAHSA
jgi:hypothetical protein